MAKVGQIHCVECRCILQQFKKLQNPPFHTFAVFSVIENDEVLPKYAQCNNCGIIHKVIDICKSEIIPGKEMMSSIVKVEDIKCQLPENLVSVLESHKVELPVWEAVKFYYENKMWGNFVILSRDTDDDSSIVKYIMLLGENMFKIETYIRKELVQ